MRRSVIVVLILTGSWLIGLLGLAQTKPVLADTESYSVFLPLLTNGSLNNSNSDLEDSFPSLTQFVNSVKNGKSLITGLYVENLLAKPIVQQPEGNYEYVSNEPETITQFMLTTPEVVGLLAHNHLAGKLFFDIEAGDWLFLIDGNGKIMVYLVVEVKSYQVKKVDGSLNYQDLNSNEVLDTAQLFTKFYMGEPHLTLQTCIAREGDPTWGRLFIYAIPVE